MRPIKIFIFLFIVLLLLAIISYFFPNDGINLGSSYRLRFPQLKSVFAVKKVNLADISGIIEKYQVQQPDTFIEKNTSDFADSIEIISDSLMIHLPIDTTFEQTDSTTTFKKKTTSPGTVNQMLEYPDNKNQALNPFFNSLQKLKSSGDLIRILHYGDSQIEGDRISSYIRKELQREFGGSGIGLFPAVIIKGTSISIEQNLSGDWERYTMQSIRNGNIYHKRLGALMSYSRFTPLIQENQNVYIGEINLRKSNNTYLNTRKFKHCKVFYGYNEKPFVAELKYKDSILDAELIPVTRDLNTISWKIDGSIDEITISFKGEDSPDIYAIALDDYKGIAVDNIPLRGSSGTDFTKTDLPFFRAMYQKLNVKLVLMQFGVNLVPHIVSDYSYYQKQLEKQLKTLKSLRPDICIIVIGVSDMSRNENGQFVTYPNIEKIRDAQKKAAFNAGCAFWDTYEAMGGKNSMPSWVATEPPLARTDYTHFTWKGSIIIAKMFYDALMTDYKKYITNTPEQIQVSIHETN